MANDKTLEGEIVELMKAVFGLSSKVSGRLLSELNEVDDIKQYIEKFKIEFAQWKDQFVKDTLVVIDQKVTAAMKPVGDGISVTISAGVQAKKDEVWKDVSAGIDRMIRGSNP